MKRLLSISLCLSAILACQDIQSQKEVRRATPSGYEYEVYADEPGEVCTTGNFVLMHTVLSYRDSVISDTRVNPGRPTVVKMEEAALRKNSSSGPVQDVLELMSIGDSARMYYPVDSFKMKPRRLANYDVVTYDIKILDVFQTEEQMNAYYAAEREKADARLNDMKRRETEVGEMMAKFYQDFEAAGREQAWETTESGLQYLVLEPSGIDLKAKTGEVVRTHYYGVLADGGVTFDNSFKRGKTLDFTIGSAPIIQGLQEAVQILNKGDKGVILIPPDLGYGAQGYPGLIPPDASLMFYVEIVGIGEMD